MKYLIHVAAPRGAVKPLDDSSLRRGVAETPSFGRVWDSSTRKGLTAGGLFSVLSTLACAPSSTTRPRVRRARETDARRVSSFPFGRVSARGKPLFRVASRVAKTHFRFERARRIFAGHLSELAGEATRATRRRRGETKARER